MTRDTDRIAERLIQRARRRPLSARNALRAAGLLAAATGTVLLVAPSWALRVCGGAAAGEAAYWLRSSGVLFLGLAVAFLAGARWASSMMQRPVLVTACAVNAMLALTGATAMLDGVIGTRYGAVVGAQAVLAAWTGWLLVTDRV